MVDIQQQFSFRYIMVAMVGTLVVSMLLFPPAVHAQEEVGVDTLRSHDTQQDAVTLRGWVAPGGADGVTAWFEYGTSPSLERRFRTTRNAVPERGFHAQRVNELLPDTRYYYRIVAESEQGMVKGNIRDFKTDPRNSSTRVRYDSREMTVETREAEDVTFTRATLRGVIRARNEREVKWWFMWEGGHLSEVTTPQELSAGPEGRIVQVRVRGLEPDTRYRYRLLTDLGEKSGPSGRAKYFHTQKKEEHNTSVPENGARGGTRDGNDTNGSASAGTITTRTRSPTRTTKGSITFAGRVRMSQVVDTDVWVEWGRTPELERKSTQRTIQGETSRTFEAPVSGLEEGTAYFYRAVARNQFGTAHGQMLVARTEGTPPPSSSSPPPQGGQHTPPPSPPSSPPSSPSQPPSSPAEGRIPSGSQRADAMEGVSTESGRTIFLGGDTTLFGGEGFFPDSLIGWLISFILMLFIVTIMYNMSEMRRRRNGRRKKEEEQQKEKKQLTPGQKTVKVEETSKSKKGPPPRWPGPGGSGTRSGPPSQLPGQ